MAYQRTYKDETAVVAFNAGVDPGVFVCPADVRGPLPEKLAETGVKLSSGDQVILAGKTGRVWVG